MIFLSAPDRIPQVCTVVIQVVRLVDVYNRVRFGFVTYLVFVRGLVGFLYTYRESFVIGTGLLPLFSRTKGGELKG